jgi:hypothetical protein
MDEAEAVFTPEHYGTYTLVYLCVLLTVCGVCGTCAGWLWCLWLHCGPPALLFAKLERRRLKAASVGAPLPPQIAPLYSQAPPVDTSRWVFS